MPSAAKKMTGVPLGAPVGFLAAAPPAAPTDTEPATSSANESVRTASSASLNRSVRFIRLLSPG